MRLFLLLTYLFIKRINRMMILCKNQTKAIQHVAHIDCGIDGVIGETQGYEITPALLAEMRKVWFDS